MCGIYGYYLHRVGGRDDIDSVAMAEAIRHRGPDDSGYHDAGFALVGNQRLSVIDVETGHQPFISDCGKVSVVQNGEIYNYVELADELKKMGVRFKSHSDTEVLLHLYMKYGNEFVNKLNGMFAIAICDQRDRTVRLFRDRMGVKPLYVAETDSAVLFASEIKALLAAGLQAEIDRESLYLYLCFNFVPPPRTIVKGVEHVEPGAMLEISSRGSKRQAWWSLSDRECGQHVARDAEEQILDVLADSVRLRMRSDVPYGAFLSGGIDSSTVVGLMSQMTADPVATYSIGFDDCRYDESPYAEEASRRFNTRHTLQRLTADYFSSWPEALFYCDQPHGDVSFVPTLKLSELAAADVKVVLTGDGGDELFAGYQKYQKLFREDIRSDRDFIVRLLSSLSLFGGELRDQLCGSYFSSVGSRIDEQYVQTLLENVSHFDYINQALYVDCRMLLPGNNLVKPDKMGMARSLEAREPFLDYRLVELAFTMPGSSKLSNGETKHILKRAVASLIGDELTYRRKQMFTVPVGEWFKSRLKDFMLEMLGESGLKSRDMFRASVIDRLIDEHCNGGTDRTRELRALIAIELWIRECLEGESVRKPWWNAGMERRLAAN